MRKKTTAEFVSKAIAINGLKYDYSKVMYSKANVKVCILCKDHGEFWQTPNNHLRGQGCGKCRGLHKSNEGIIEQFNIIHNNRYDYKLVNYTAWDVKIDIICKEHGLFKQLPNDHMRGRGCQSCGVINASAIKTNCWEDVLARMKLVHGCKYDYTESKYTKMINKIDIKCNKCDHKFLMSPNAHIGKSNGCPKCAGNAKTTWDNFIKRANEVHGSFYEYPEYTGIKNNNTKISIKCPKHNIFKQSVAKHLAGQGCKSCVHKISKAEQELFDYIKTIKNDAIQSDRKIIKPYEIDIYIPSIKLGIEYNGDYWHSEKFRHINHREYKTQMCLNKGVTLIHVEESDWKNDKEKIKNNIKQLIIK